jgi:hypothetical protein
MKKLILFLISIVITSMHVHGQLNKSFVDLNSTSTNSSIDVDFGTVGDFIIFTGVGAVANTGVSTVTGNVGSNAGAIAGFGAPSVLNGVIENANAVSLQASLDLVAACVELQNIPATITDHNGVFGSVGGETIFPGVYSVGTAVAITGTLTLDAQGDPDAIFLFKITGALNSVAGATVLLANGASSDNVFWIAVGAVGLGANSTMIGTAIGYPGAVSLGAGGSMDGRLYATIGAIATDSFVGTIPVAASTDDVSSGNDGGLESNGNLASLIAKRNFKRKKGGKSLNKKIAQLKFKKTKLKRNNNSSSLIDYLPETGVYRTETSNVSSPIDLLGVTNAKEILSVDYYQEERRIAAVLATITEGKIYDHTKIICDRLNNSSLEDIRTVKIRDHKIISSKIKRATGQVEYTLSFSTKMGGAKDELFSFWNIDQYPTGNYQNYQIWGSSYPQIFSIASFIIDIHTFENGLKSTEIENILPNVFVKSGSYTNGFLELSLVNKTNETAIIFDGNIAETEVSEHYNITRNLSLTGNYNETLYIDTGVLFDIGFSLQTNTTAQKDVLYLADGPWGLDYLKEYATVEKFKIEVGERSYLEDVYEVDRNASASGQVKGNINLFRHLLPGDQTLDVTNYNAINFSLQNNQPVEIVIMQEDNRTWYDRLRYTVAANSDAKDYNIVFNNFKNAEGIVVEITNIKTIVFSVIGDYVNSIPYNITANNVSFVSQGSLATSNTAAVRENKLINYPNPFANSTTIKLVTSSEFVQIKVFDILGRLVDLKKLNTANSENEAQYNSPNLKSGIYKYLLKDDNENSHSGTFIVN